MILITTDLMLIRRPSRGRNHGRMTVKPRWIARFAAFAIPRCRDLLGSIDRTTDRTRDRNRPWIAGPAIPPKRARGRARWTSRHGGRYAEHECQGICLQQHQRQPQRED